VSPSAGACSVQAREGERDDIHQTPSPSPRRRFAHSPFRFLRPLELGVKGIKTFEALGEDLLIGQTLLCPTFEDLFNSEAFDSMKFFIFQIGVMNQLGDSQNRAIPNGESFDKSFESTRVGVMAELNFKHVIRDGVRSCCRRVGEDELRVLIDKLSD
jgi:hypothetical protein